jgi:hypothetical protein
MEDLKLESDSMMCNIKHPSQKLRKTIGRKTETSINAEDKREEKIRVSKIIKSKTKINPYMNLLL